MSQSQQPFSKVASLDGFLSSGKLRPTISLLGLALKVHLHILMILQGLFIVLISLGKTLNANKMGLCL